MTARTETGIDTGALGLPLREVDEVVQALLAVLVDRGHQLATVVEHLRDPYYAFDEVAAWDLIGPTVNDLAERIGLAPFPDRGR